MLDFDYDVLGNKNLLNGTQLLGVFTTRFKTPYSRNFICDLLGFFKTEVVLVMTFEIYKVLGLERLDFKKILIFDNSNCKDIEKGIKEGELRIHLKNLPEDDIRTRYLLKDIFISNLVKNIVILEATGYSKNLEILNSYCADRGVNVYCLPGRIYDNSSKGTNRMIFNGAIPLFSLDLLKM